MVRMGRMLHMRGSARNGLILRDGLRTWWALGSPLWNRGKLFISIWTERIKLIDEIL